jgi:hypothetical protein
MGKWKVIKGDASKEVPPDPEVVSVHNYITQAKKRAQREAKKTGKPHSILGFKGQFVAVTPTQESAMNESVSEVLHPGDVIELHLMRVPIYEPVGYAPAERESKKTFAVRSVGKHGTTLRPVRREKKVRGWTLNNSQRTLNSFTKPPLKYEVLKLTVKKRAKTESVRELAQELRSSDGS